MILLKKLIGNFKRRKFYVKIENKLEIEWALCDPLSGEPVSLADFTICSQVYGEDFSDECFIFSHILGPIISSNKSKASADIGSKVHGKMKNIYEEDNVIKDYAKIPKNVKTEFIHRHINELKEFERLSPTSEKLRGFYVNMEGRNQIFGETSYSRKFSVLRPGGLKYFEIWNDDNDDEIKCIWEMDSYKKYTNLKNLAKSFKDASPSRIRRYLESKINPKTGRTILSEYIKFLNNLKINENTTICGIEFLPEEVNTPWANNYRKSNKIKYEQNQVENESDQNQVENVGGSSGIVKINKNQIVRDPKVVKIIKIRYKNKCGFCDINYPEEYCKATNIHSPNKNNVLENIIHFCELKNGIDGSDCSENAGCGCYAHNKLLDSGAIVIMPDYSLWSWNQETKQYDQLLNYYLVPKKHYIDPKWIIRGNEFKVAQGIIPKDAYEIIKSKIFDYEDYEK